MSISEKNRLWTAMERYIPLFFRPFLGAPIEETEGSYWS
jgi:hypothetical protein